MINLLKALADENRMRIFNLLIESELCVCEIETILGISQSNTSRHLTKLKQVGIISSSKDAQWVHYEVADQFIDEHKSLMVYLKEKLSQDQVYIEDIKKYRKYSDLGLNCTDIKDNADNVVQLIGEK